MAYLKNVLNGAAIMLTFFNSSCGLTCLKCSEFFMGDCDSLEYATNPISASQSDLNICDETCVSHSSLTSRGVRHKCFSKMQCKYNNGPRFKIGGILWGFGTEIPKYCMCYNTECNLDDILRNGDEDDKNKEGGFYWIFLRVVTGLLGFIACFHIGFAYQCLIASIKLLGLFLSIGSFVMLAVFAASLIKIILGTSA